MNTTRAVNLGVRNILPAMFEVDASKIADLGAGKILWSMPITASLILAPELPRVLRQRLGGRASFSARFPHKL